VESFSLIPRILVNSFQKANINYSLWLDIIVSSSP